MRPRTAHALRGPACSLSDIIKFGYLHQVRALISTGLDLESRDENGRTPLLLCAFMQPPDWGASIAMTLIEHGADMSQRDCLERNVLHYACIYERVKLVRILLKAVDFDLNQADYVGNTPLHYAAMSGNVAIAQLLIQSFKRYRISLSKRNHRGRTALDEALLSGHVPCTQVIQEELAAKQTGNLIKDVRFADSVMNGVESGPERHSERVLRPKTAAFPSRHFRAACIDVFDDPVRSSTKSMQINTRKSGSSSSCKDYKRDEELIFCAPREDFRNTPEYVFRLVRVPYDPSSVEPVSLHDTTYRSNWTDSSSNSSQSQQTTGAEDWRNQLKVLFQVYEHQCSPSWRTAKAAEQLSGSDQEQSTPLDEIDGDDKEKKTGRQQSVNSRNSNYADTKRRQSNVRVNKLKPKDTATDATSESTIRPLSSKKRN
ncbi:hypothetical protein BgiMline_013139 [Biomphalaria glabrata]|uniref:Uncharacterized protein LOC106062008 n=1 Tax=Biomphalaria glabrata TaxID=6526 RepID=A0A9U8E876_BIOGL|nr:uncharacterized protein LOC106062008 [Biomphalaria glabrata]XP_013075719.2 uncharacterized protein LOC106062008 [Biomphalaria glabrata]KAI8750003.1 CAunnamed protein product [Biomphalaria glabrata]